MIGPEKVLQNKRIVFPLPPGTTVRGYEIFHDISMGLETICAVGDYLCMPHPLKNTYNLCIVPRRQPKFLTVYEF